MNIRVLEAKNGGFPYFAIEHKNGNDNSHIFIIIDNFARDGNLSLEV